TTGFTGADLANLVNEAAVVATRRNSAQVTFEDVTVALERIVAGLEKKSRILTPPERRRVAYHEIGHALVAASLPGVDPVLKVSIIPRGVGALGFTMQRPTEDRFLLARSDLENRIALLMGGRAAEVMVFDGDVSTGAADDLQRATEVAQEMVTHYGMAESLGNRVYAPPRHSFLGDIALPPMRGEISEQTTREIDLAVRELVETAERRALAVLQARRADLDAGAALLLEHETLTADDFPPLRRGAEAATTGAPRPPGVPAGVVGAGA